MNQFYVGLHHPSDAWPFRSCMISVNTLRSRKSHFRVNDWILDSGAFSQLSKYGRFLLSTDDYLEQINRFSTCGVLKAAVAQDWMCEPFVIEKTGKSLGEHQDLSIRSFVELSQWTDVPILPVLQGFEPADYASHVRQYGSLLMPGHWVGVGSVCKRNGNPDAVEDVLLAIKAQRPDLKLHGFGLKIEALERPTITSMLYSSDSMAWSYAGRRDADGNDPRDALRYAARVEELIDKPSFIQPQLFQWWS